MRFSLLNGSYCREGKFRVIIGRKISLNVFSFSQQASDWRRCENRIEIVHPGPYETFFFVQDIISDSIFSIRRGLFASVTWSGHGKWSVQQGIRFGFKKTISPHE